MLSSKARHTFKMKESGWERQSLLCSVIFSWEGVTEPLRKDTQKVGKVLSMYVVRSLISSFLQGPSANWIVYNYCKCLLSN